MSVIMLNKTACAFLASATSTDETRPHLQHIYATDDKMLVATDGYRLHAVPATEDHNPGYYVWHKNTEMLMQISDANVEGSHTYAMYLAENHRRTQLMKSATVGSEPMPVVSIKFQEITEWKLEFPKVTKVGHSFTFRKGMVEGKPFAFCLGLNALPLAFGEDGAVTLAKREDVLIVEAKYILDAYWPGLVRPVMRWGAGCTPVLIGDLDGAHALVMPFANAVWKTPVDLQGLDPSAKVTYAYYGNGNSKITA